MDLERRWRQLTSQAHLGVGGLAIWLIIGLGAGLRLIDLGRDALWYDEAFTAWLARLPLPAMLEAIAGDVHPPAWYLIEWGVVRLFGSSELALRAPACLIGIVNLWLAWQVARRLASKPVAWLATAIFALSPFQIYYSQEARMYGLLQLCVLASVWAVLARKWAALAGAALLGLLTHNLMAVYLVGIFGVAVWRERRSLCTQWGPGVAAIVTVVCYVPWALWLLVPQIGAVGGSFWVQPVTVGGFFYPLYILVFHLAAPAWLQLHAGLLIAALVGWGSLRAWAHHRAILILAWGPLALLAVISLVWQPVYLHRTLIGASLFFYLLAALALHRAARVLAQPVGVIAVLAVVPLFISTGNFYLSPDARRWDVRQDAAALGCAPGDVVYHVNPASLILFQYYRPDCDHWLWPAANDLSQSLKQLTKNAMGMQQAELDQIPHTWAWLVWVENPVMHPDETATVGKILLLNNYTLIHQSQPADLVTMRIWGVWR
jgi:hypothetical protein